MSFINHCLISVCQALWDTGIFFSIYFLPENQLLISQTNIVYFIENKFKLISFGCFRIDPEVLRYFSDRNFACIFEMFITKNLFLDWQNETPYQCHPVLSIDHWRICAHSKSVTEVWCTVPWFTESCYQSSYSEGSLWNKHWSKPR